MSKQNSQKSGKQSTAQKRDSSRHDFDPIPATSKVDGAHGERERTTRTMNEVTDQYTEERMRNRDQEQENEEKGQD
jgi:hypothetical protein